MKAATPIKMLLMSAAAISLTGPAKAQGSPSIPEALSKAEAAYAKADYVEAARWLRTAADQGSASAQFNLGVMYDDGQGVPQNYAEAVRWYRLAAEQGDPSAQSNLGLMYASGRDVPQNYVEAYKWWSLAATQGEAAAAKNRDMLSEKMTPEQIAEAQALSTTWKRNSATGSVHSDAVH